jgi:hypothetical protein
VGESAHGDERLIGGDGVREPGVDDGAVDLLEDDRSAGRLDDGVQDAQAQPVAQERAVGRAGHGVPHDTVG